MPKVGVVLSGCGFLDGAEVYEATLTLLALDRRGIQYQCLAPDVQQMHVVNHLTKQPTNESRNVLVERPPASREGKSNHLRMSRWSVATRLFFRVDLAPPRITVILP